MTTSTDQEARLFDEVDHLAQEARRVSQDTFARIVGWLVAANAGALVLVFNAFLDNKLSSLEAIRPIALLFVAGIFFGVASAAVDYWNTRAFSDANTKLHRQMKIMSAAAASLKNRGAHEPPPIGKEDEAVVRLRSAMADFENIRAKAAPLITATHHVCHAFAGFSALSFTFGVLVPLFQS